MRMMQIIKKIAIFCTVVYIFVPFFAFAQSENDVSLSISPTHPAPGAQAVAQLINYSFNLAGSKITWFLNEKESGAGIGLRKFSFATKTDGADTIIGAKIEAPNGIVLNKSITINGENLDMLIEADDSFIPPFYEGRNIPANESQIKVVAVPSTYDPKIARDQKDFVFSWIRNFNSALKGYGENALVFKQSVTKTEENISVTASPLSGFKNIFGSISIVPRKAKIVFYEKDPGRGVNFNKALNSGFNLTKNSVIIYASPYFFSGANLKTGDLKFHWSINGEEVAEATSNELSVNKGAGSGSATISLSIESRYRLYQEATASFVINY